MKTLIRPLAVLLTLALLAAACGGSGSDDSAAADSSSADSATDAGADDDSDGADDTDDDSDGADDTDDDSDADDADDADGAEAPSLDNSSDTRGLDPDGTLRIGYTVGPTRFDAHKATSSFDNTSLYLTYDRLIHQSPSAEAVPGLSESWEFADDNSYLQLNLRQGVTFHDGEPFNAEAVKANIERAKTVEGSAVAPELAVVDSVEIIDEYTVRLMLNGPAASLPLVLADRPGMMISPAAFDNEDLSISPVGTGMYRVTDYRQDDKITYERYEGYWEPEAIGAGTVEYFVMPDSTTRLNAVRSGQLDWTLIDPIQIADAESAGLTVVPTPSLSYMRMQLNRSFEPFSDLRVRQALNHAVNSEAIVDAVLLGYADVNQQVFPEWYFGFDEDTGTNSYPFDPDKARELLAEAGYADGFEFEIVVPTIPIYLEVFQAVQAMMADVGLTATLRSTPGAQVTEVFYAKEEGQAVIAPWGGRPDPSQTLYLLFTPDGFSNPGDHSTEAFVEAYEATLIAGEGRDAAVRAASAQLTADALEVAFYFAQTPFVYTDSVVGFQQWFSGKPEFRFMGVSTE